MIKRGIQVSDDRVVRDEREIFQPDYAEQQRQGKSREGISDARREEDRGDDDMKQEKEDRRAFHAAGKMDQQRSSDPIQDDLPDGNLLVGVGFGASDAAGAARSAEKPGCKARMQTPIARSGPVGATTLKSGPTDKVKVRTPIPASQRKRISRLTLSGNSASTIELGVFANKPGGFMASDRGGRPTADLP